MVNRSDFPPLPLEITLLRHSYRDSNKVLNIHMTWSLRYDSFYSSYEDLDFFSPLTRVGGALSLASCCESVVRFMYKVVIIYVQ